jgi:hypothetical protein
MDGLDDTQRSFYGLKFENTFLRVKGKSFENFFARVMAHGFTGDFEPVRPYGPNGDLKCDGSGRATAPCSNPTRPTRSSLPTC